MVGGDIYSSITSVGELLICAGAGWAGASAIRSRRRACAAAPEREPVTVLDRMIKEYLSSDSWTSTIEFLEKTEKLSPEKCFAPHTARVVPGGLPPATSGYSRTREAAISAAVMSTPRVAGWAPVAESVRVTPWPAGRGGYDVDGAEVNTTTLVELRLRVKVDEKETLQDVTRRVARLRRTVLDEVARADAQTRLSSASASALALDDDYRPGRLLSEHHRQLIGQGMLTTNEVRSILSDSNGRPLFPSCESYFHDLVKRDLERRGELT